MSLENFPQTVPISPDKSERIDDPEKAKAMAEAGNISRAQAAENRKKLKDGSWVPSLEEEFTRKAEFNDKKAEKFEGDEAFMFEVEKSAKGMSDEELLVAAGQSIFDEKNVRANVFQLRQTAIDQPGNQSIKEELKNKEDDWHKAGMRASVFNGMIGQRKREQKESSN